MNETKTDWFFIINPCAGSGKTMSEWVEAQKSLGKEGISFETAYTSHKKHATSIAYNAAGEGYRNIAAVGGDGSLHEVFGGICQWCRDNSAKTEDFCIAVVPIGSGNDWIKSFDVPDDVDEVIGLIKKDKRVSMDVIEVDMDEGRTGYMANGAGIGFDSHVCQRVNIQKEAGMRGKIIYLNALRYTITHLSPIRIRVEADGVKVFEGECYSMAIGNGRYSGNGMRQVPLARPDDGKLDYLIVPKISVITIIKEIPRLFKGTVHEYKKTVYGQCSSLRITPLDEKSADIIEIDGEIEGRLPLSINMKGEHIQVIKG